MYTARLAAGLQRGGRWQATVVTARLRPGQPQNSIEPTTVDGVPVQGIVQNYPYRGLPEAVDDPALDRVFAGIVRQFRPDLVSVQTLAGLSAGFLDVAMAAGVPVAVHLHDGWWSCPSGGQRLHGDGSLCLPVDRSRCSSCFATYLHHEGPLERGARALAARLPERVPADTLHRAFQSLPSGGQEFLRRINERGARLRERHAPTDGGTSRAAQVDPAIAARSQRLQQVLARVDQVISPSRFLAESLAADGLHFPTLKVEATGVPLPTDSMQPRGTTEGALRVLFLGTWVRHKGPQVLAQALATLPEDLFTDGLIQAQSVGPVPFPAFQQDTLADSHGRLLARPAVEPSEVPALLASVDVVVIPSLWAENAPLVALEARAAGTPVIASRLGGLPELVRDGVDGRLFPPGDVQALADILEELARNRASLQTLANGLRPPRSVADFVAAIEATYCELLDANSARATGT